ncbi:MAG TPA: HEAT repeat domain-containing protein [Lacisediminihabitans sp.]|uniref:HEAT repeat domain-containing protein n=1 Tax=Lacisediminihabitans sp. TaxID=2787631 RepID=UPI002EDBA616
MKDRLAEELRSVPATELKDYLIARSGLPGPRANLELADAFSSVADRATILGFAALDEEYLRFCDTEAIGRLLVDDPDDTSLPELARIRAADESWRVREGAARALQILGDHDRTRLRAIVGDWVVDDDPYVRRAAIAAICEPRLLADPETRSAAISACRTASTSILEIPTAQRSAAAVRNLRQALGYCWSVAAAADPRLGMAAFEWLRTFDDPDMRWIVTSNLGKARLRRLLER